MDSETLRAVYRTLELTAARVGGVVSETSFKFFIQFVGWTAIYCIFNLIVAAYFLAEYKKQVSKLGYFDPQFAIHKALISRQGHSHSQMSYQESLIQRSYIIRLTNTLKQTRTLNVHWLVVVCL